jgi:hypothetical protein
VINQLMLYILAAGLTAIAYVNKAGIVTYNYSNTLHESDDDGGVGRHNSFRVLRSHRHSRGDRGYVGHGAIMYKAIKTCKICLKIVK